MYIASDISKTHVMCYLQSVQEQAGDAIRGSTQDDDLVGLGEHFLSLKRQYGQTAPAHSFCLLLQSFRDTALLDV